MDPLLWWLVIGLVIGSIAPSFYAGSPTRKVIVLSIVFSSMGALAGGWVGRALGIYGEVAWFVMAMGGAVIAILIYRVVVSRRPSSGPTRPPPRRLR